MFGYAPTCVRPAGPGDIQYGVVKYNEVPAGIAEAIIKNSSLEEVKLCPRKKFAREKPHVNVGTIGHVDHGKTITH